MSETPVELIVSAFQSEQGADNALDEIVAAKKEKLVRIREAAVVRRDKNGKLHINERGDLTTGGGAASGAAIGAVIGLFGGPIGALLGGAAGAAIGGLAGKLIDTGIPDHRLKQIGSALQPGTSAIVAMIEHSWVNEIQAEFDRAGGDSLAAAVTEDIKNQLAAGKEVAYSAVAAAGGSIATRTSAGPEGVSVQGIATDGQNMLAGAVKATEDKVEGVITDGQSLVAGAITAVQDTASEAVEAAKNLGDDVADAAKGVVAAATEVVAEAKDTVAEAAEQAGDVAADTKKTVTGAVKEATS